MKLSKYSYRTRLITGFSLIILFNILSIFISLNKIQENQDDLNLMYAHPLVVSNAVREINSDINAIHRTMKDVALSKNRQELAKALKRVMGYDENIKKNFRVVLDRFLGDIKLVKKAEETYLNWRPIRLQVIDLIEQGEKEAAAKITKTIGDDYVFSLLNTTQEMIDFAKHKADQLYFDNLKKQKKASRQLYVLLLSLSILSFIISLIISKSISAPIKKLVSRITQSLDKDFNKESVFFMRSEQETLELAIKALEEYHEKITNFNKNLNQKVQEKTKNLTEANKSLQDLVYIASHDLQVPLVSMVGFTTELLEEHKDSLNKDGVYCLTRIQSNAKRMHKLVLSLLDLSRLNTHINPYQEFSLSKMISEILKDLSLTISKAKTNITYSKLSKIYADKQRIEGVFRNLIQNAISYEAKNIEIGFDKDTFFIKDDGIGIPKDQLQKIFLAGERLKFNNAEGVGMGLAFCKKAIELHGGAIWAESNGHNKGAIFYIKFTSNTLIS